MKAGPAATPPRSEQVPRAPAATAADSSPLPHETGPAAARTTPAHAPPADRAAPLQPRFQTRRRSRAPARQNATPACEEFPPALTAPAHAAVAQTAWQIAAQ